MTAAPADVSEIACQLAAGLASRLTAELAPGLGQQPREVSRPAFVGLDGWSGSGKTTLAEALAGELGAAVVHLDDLVAGWGDLAGSVSRLVEVVLPALAAGRSARWRRWDWAAGASGPQQCQVPAPLVLVEGCGAGSAPVRPWLSALVWLEVAPALRAARLRGRPDWVAYRRWFDVWTAQEDVLRAGDDPRPLADVLVVDDGSACRVCWPAGA